MPARRGGSSTPAATPGATTQAPSRAAWASTTTTSTGSSPPFGRRDHARLAGADARGRPDLILLDEPTNHLDVASLEWLERGSRRSTRRASWSRTTAGSGSGDERHARARGRPGHPSSRPPARVAAREGTEGCTRAEDRRPRRGGHRQPRALRRPVPLQEEQGQASSGEADADRPPHEGEGLGGLRGGTPHAQDSRARVRLRRPQRSGRDSPRPRARGRRGGGSHAAQRRHPRPGAGRARGARRPERKRQDDAPRTGGAGDFKLGHGVDLATSPSMGWSWTSAAACSTASRR